MLFLFLLLLTSQTSNSFIRRVAVSRASERGVTTTECATATSIRGPIQLNMVNALCCGCPSACWMCVILAAGSTSAPYVSFVWPNACALPLPPPLPLPLPVLPLLQSPVPLFQGQLISRVTNFYRRLFASPFVLSSSYSIIRSPTVGVALTRSQ